MEVSLFAMVLYSMLLLSFVLFCLFVVVCVCVCVSFLEDQGGMLSGDANYAELRVSAPHYRPALSAAGLLTFPYRELPQRRAALIASCPNGALIALFLSRCLTSAPPASAIFQLCFPVTCCAYKGRWAVSLGPQKIKDSKLNPCVFHKYMYLVKI